MLLAKNITQEFASILTGTPDYLKSFILFYGDPTFRMHYCISLIFLKKQPSQG